MAKSRLNKRYVLILRWLVPSLIGASILGLAVVYTSGRIDPSAPNSDGTISGLTSSLSRNVTPDMVRFQLTDVSESTGIDFHHFPSPRHSLLPEDMGSGLAWGDYDNDGDSDLFLVNFCGAILAPVPENPPQEQSFAQGRCALYRNDGNGRFTDVSRRAGVNYAFYGLAAAWGDYDNDDDLDLYVSSYGANTLFRNNGDGTFVDVTAAAGVGDPRFGAGCAWADYNNDGRLDLYVCNYVDFELRNEDRDRMSRQFGSEIPYTINPSTYPPQANLLYRNKGDGAFENVANETGVANQSGRSLGAVWFDFDDDGWIDLYVANDVSSNGVFRNRGDGTFADIGARSLAADYRGAMGLAVGDVDRDGDLDLFVTHWLAQENAYFENMLSLGYTHDDGSPNLFFMDSADEHGLGQISLHMVGWATGFVDFDNDSRLDLWVVNGSTMEMSDDNSRLVPQRMHVFRQESTEGFFEMGTLVCPQLDVPFVGRGGAHADYDNDGRMDLAVMVHGGHPILLHNESVDVGRWIVVRLRQIGANTHAVGAKVTVRTGDVVQTAQVGADCSYLSQSDTDLHFGIGQSEMVDELTIHWPDGFQQSLQNVDANQLVSYTHTPQYETSPSP
ncbi:CRTAC1 family protein [Pirellulales bacterium]|nr:CRTAC1 family protein [Pirellulales bacterium]